LRCFLYIVSILLIIISCKKEEEKSLINSDSFFAFSTATYSVNQFYFTALSNSLDYSWDFGNGNSLLGRSANQYFPDSGYYDVTLTVNNNGDTVKSTRTIIVVNDDWDFIDNFYVDTLLVDSNKRLGFIGEIPPPFSILDEVYIIQSLGSFNPEYDGKTTVKNIYQNSDSNWVLLTDKKFLNPSTPNPGKIVLYPYFLDFCEVYN
jgi:PKD repeat protein